MTEKPTYEELEKIIRKLEKIKSVTMTAKEAMLESEERFRVLFESTTSCILFVEDRKMKYINQATLKTFGYTKNEMIGEDTSIIHASQESFEESGRIAYKSVQEQGYWDGELQFKRKDGETMWMSTYLSELPKSGIVAILHDITEHKQAEEALRLRESYLTAILENQPGLIWLKDVDSRFLTVNQAFADSCGKASPAELVGKADLDIWPKELAEKYRADDASVIKNKASIMVEEPIFDHGQITWFETFKTPVLDDQGKVIGTTGYARDITERKQVEEEKIKAHKNAGEHEKLSLVGQVAGKMAHDFNNVLSIIMGNTELSLIDCKDAETRKTLELIFEQTLRGKNLTRNMVAFAKDQEPKQEFFKISEKIDLVLNLMRKDLEGIELIKEDKSGVPDLLADPGMIEHALINLIQNSIHALSMNEHPRIIVRIYSRDNHICFEIEDNGCGISKQNLENIYEPSFTLKGSKDVSGSYKSDIKGTGYGMSNVKKYIEQHKGKISIESELASGTKFTISLPLIKKELTIEEKIELQEKIKHFEKYILLVEDETAISDVQYRILTSEPINHKVDVAHNGQIAKDLFDRNKYDFVSLDYVLPGGINGMDVYHHIRKTNQTVPVLFISGNIEFLESIKGLKQKDAYIDHMSKPCQNKDYVNGINELLKNIS